jgi:site-specific DNA-methyltransferase (adenine-specific)
MNTKSIKANRSNQTNFILGLGNCLDVLQEIPAQSVDMVLCDLPYGITRHRWDTVISLEPLWAAYNRVCKPKANIVLFAAQPFSTVLSASKLDWFRYELVWFKNKGTGHLNAKRQPLSQHELVLVFRRKSGGTYNPQMSTGHRPMHHATNNPTKGSTYGAQGKLCSRGGSTKRYPSSVLQFPRLNNDDPRRIHPHQKPVALLEYLIKTYSRRGDVVLDNTMGSGATGIACASTGRQFIGLEQDPIYFERAEAWLLSTP